ncbi:MAG TPA: hypothetical protein VG389_18535 [Myxococcota bacterium]|jgi:hypothetical protein|nr:hypothetical protein [Myxococcota bacterium]
MLQEHELMPTADKQLLPPLGLLPSPAGAPGSVPPPVTVPHPAQLPLPGLAPELALRLTVRDPEVIAELMRFAAGEDRNRYALAALRLGVLSLRVASGQLDAGAIQQAGEKLVADVRDLLSSRAGEMTAKIAGTLAQYFDPRNGVVEQRFQSLVQKDGEMERMLRQHLGPDESVLARTLAMHLGEGSPIFKMLAPDEATGLRAGLEKTLEHALAEQRVQVLREFSLDHKDSALSRLLAEMRTRQTEMQTDMTATVSAVMNELTLDQPNSALSRVVKNLTLDDEHSALSRLKRELMGTIDDLVRRNTEFQTDVRATLAGLQARREEAARSTRHGVSFEAELGELLAREAQRLGDLAEACGHSTGNIKNNKVGDHVTELGRDSAAPGARIVWEAKEDRGYDLRRALAEIDVARKNRGAQIGVFVFSARTSPPEMQPLARHGDDLVVVWDADQPATDLHVRAAYSVARALAIRVGESSEEAAAAVHELELATRAVEKQIQHLDELRRWGQTVQSNGEKIVERTDRMRADLAAEVERLDRVVAALRASE